jgi:hypothetical protein
MSFQQPDWLAVSIANMTQISHVKCKIGPLPAVTASGGGAAGTAGSTSAAVTAAAAASSMTLNPILAYTGGAEINLLQWSIAQPNWQAVRFANMTQILRV